MRPEAGGAARRALTHRQERQERGDGGYPGGYGAYGWQGGAYSWHGGVYHGSAHGWDGGAYHGGAWHGGGWHGGSLPALAISTPVAVLFYDLKSDARASRADVAFRVPPLDYVGLSVADCLKLNCDARDPILFFLRMREIASTTY
jgi:hypothetical protein